MKTLRTKYSNELPIKVTDGERGEEKTKEVRVVEVVKGDFRCLGIAYLSDTRETQDSQLAPELLALSLPQTGRTTGRENGEGAL